MTRPSSFAFALALTIASTTVALAQPAVVIGDAVGAPGDTVSVSMEYLGDGTVVAFDYIFTFDEGALDGTPRCESIVGGAPFACNIPTIEPICFPGDPAACFRSSVSEFRALAFSPILEPIKSDSLGSVDFAISRSAQPGVYPLTVISETYGDASGDSVPSVGTMSGSVTVISSVEEGLQAELR